uniref:Uncharacterized protein UPF0065 n=2 Tax=Cupriavidus TaxID=106589 RepID=Q46MR2_CUPPJ
MPDQCHSKARRYSIATLIRASAIMALGVAPLAAFAAWPDKPIRIVVPSAPGGSADAIARLVGERLTKALGQPVVIDNKGGGGGNIATEAVARSPADGYTLLLTGNNHSLNVSLFPKAPYRLDDFTSVIELTRGPSVFVVGAGAPFASLGELIRRAKAAPDSIAFGSPGIGLPSHIAFEMFERDAGIKLVHVPYKGSGPSLADGMGGQVPVVSSTLAAAMPHIKAGKLRALAVTSAMRWHSLPDVPTVAEITGSRFEHMTWLGILAPKGTPASIVLQLNRQFDTILQAPDFRAKLDALGTTPVGGSGAAFQKVIDTEAAASRALVHAAKLKAE